MTDHKIGSREEWQAAREDLLRREKENTRRADELAQQRPKLPLGGGALGLLHPVLRHRSSSVERSSSPSNRL